MWSARQLEDGRWILENWEGLKLELDAPSVGPFEADGLAQHLDYYAATLYEGEE